MNDKQSTVSLQGSMDGGSMLERVFKYSHGGERGTFQKTSVTNLTEEDMEQIRSMQNGREVNHPFEDGDFMEILKRGGDKLDAIRKKMVGTKNEDLED
jgi:hypothetical protein